MTSDLVLLFILEGVCGVGLLIVVVGIPLSDLWMRRQIRKQLEYTRKLEEEIERRTHARLHYIKNTPHGEN